jgi:hypothetical protein
MLYYSVPPRPWLPVAFFFSAVVAGGGDIIIMIYVYVVECV